MGATDRSLSWLAQHPLPTVLGLIAIGSALGSAWFYATVGVLYNGVGLSVPKALAGATVLVIVAVFLLGMYVGQRIEVD